MSITHSAITEAIAAIPVTDAATQLAGGNTPDAAPAEMSPASDNTPAAETHEAEKPKADEAKPTDRLSKSWASISQKEAKLRTEMKALRETKAQMDAAMAEMQELRQLKSLLKEDPIAVLDKEAGKDWYQKATERFLKEPSGKVPLEDEVHTLKSQLEKERQERDKWFEEKWTERAKVYESQVHHQTQAAQYIDSMHKLAQSDDRFELTRSTPGGIDAAMEVTNGYLKEYGKLLSPEESLNLVEQELEAQAESLFKASKLRTKYGITQQAAQDSSQKATKSVPKNLTEKMSASGTPVNPQTRAEKLAEAAKLLRRLQNERGV